MASYFIDAQGGNDTTGDGSIGNPWNTIQHALDNTTLSTSGPHQFNLKGTFTLSSNPDFTTHGGSTATSRTTFRGYGTTENDGTRATIASDGTFSMSIGSSYINNIDLIFDGAGATTVTAFAATSGNLFLRCKFQNGDRSGSANYTFYSTNVLIQCDLVCSGGWGCYLSGSSNKLFDTYIESDLHGIYIGSSGSGQIVEGCFIVTNGTGSSGFYANAQSHTFRHNTVLSTAASTGSGFHVNSSWYGSNTIFDNLIEGFSGSGGNAIFHSQTTATGAHCPIMVVNNSHYNCDSGIEAKLGGYEDGNESLGASPFAKTGTRDFANRYTYFAPIDIGNVIGGALINPGIMLNRGAVQTEELSPSRHPLARF